jgi:hypothetical protein
MEARASFNGPSVSKTFVAAILVLVAMGLGAMGGYVTKGLTAGGSAAQGQDVVKAAAGSVLRQDNPVHTSTRAAAGSVLRQDNTVSAPAEVPAWIQNEFPQVPNRISQDDQYFIAQSGTTSPAAVEDNGLRNRGGHKDLP